MRIMMNALHALTTSTLLLLLCLTTTVSSFQQQSPCGLQVSPSRRPFFLTRSLGSTSAGTGPSSRSLWNRKTVTKGPVRSTSLSMSSAITSSLSDSDLARANKVAVWAIIAAGTNLAYYLYNNLGGTRATWIGVGVMTQVAGFVVRTLQNSASKNNTRNSWLRNLLVFQSVGLSLFSHGVFLRQWTKGLVGVSIAVGLWAFARDKSKDAADDSVSYPLLTTLRVNEVVQVAAAKQLFVPVLTQTWPRLVILNLLPVSIGAFAMAILPSCLQYVGAIFEGDYAEGGASGDEGERLTGYVCFLVSFFLLTAYTRGLAVGVGGGLVAAAARQAGRGGTRSATRGLFANTGKRAGGLELPFDFVVKIEANK